MTNVLSDRGPDQESAGAEDASGARLLVAGRAPVWWRGDVAVAVALAVAAAALYVATAAPSVATVFDDSLEFQVVLPTLGIAHPSGYPLYTLLGHLICLLPAGTAAFRANALSGLFAGIAVSLLYSVCREVRCGRAAAVVAALIFAVSPVWWSQATIAEVYTLHVCLALLVLWLSLRLAAAGSSAAATARMTWLGLALGLGLTHHRMTLLLLPAVAIAFWAARTAPGGRGKWVRPALVALAPLLLYAYIPLRGLSTTSLDGTYRNTIAGFVAHVSASGYGAFLQGNPLAARPWAAADYLALFRQQFGYLGMALALVGLVAALPRLPRALLAAALLCNLGFAFAYHVPDVEVFFLPSFAIVSVYVSLGTDRLARLPARLSRAGVTRAAAWLVPLGVAIVALLSLPLRFIEQDRSADWSVAQQGMTWLGDVEPNGAVIGLLGEVTLLRYFQEIDGLRPDVTLVAADAEEQRLAAVRSLVAEGRPTYVTRPLAGLADEFDLDAARTLVRVSPPGAGGEAVTGGEDVAPSLALVRHELGASQWHGRAQVEASLTWLASEALTTDMKVSLRAGRRGVELARLDAYPVHGTYGTLYWGGPGAVPESIDDFYVLPMPVGDGGGSVDVTLVLYEAATGSEVAVVPLGSVMVPSSPGRRPVDEWDMTATPALASTGAMLLGAGPSGVLQARAGDTLAIDALWRAGPGGAVGRYAARLLSGGSEYGRVDLRTDAIGLAAGDMVRLTGALRLPARLSSGSYEVVLASCDGRGAALIGPVWPPVSTSRPLATVNVIGRERTWVAPQPLYSVGVHFGGDAGPVALLVGYDMELDGGRLLLTLYWQALAEPETRYKVFVHCVDPNGTVVAQSDGEPGGNSAPTDSWVTGEYVIDQHTLDLGEWPGRSLGLYVGLYLEGAGRLQPGGGEAVDGALLLTELGE